MTRLILVEGWSVADVAIYYGVAEATLHRMLGLLRMSGHVPQPNKVAVDLGRFFDGARVR